MEPGGSEAANGLHPGARGRKSRDVRHCSLGNHFKGCRLASDMAYSLRFRSFANRGIALEEKTEVDAAVSLFSYAGYQTEKFAGLMLEKKCLNLLSF